MTQFEPGQRVQMLVPSYPISSFGEGDDPEIVDPRYWGKEGEIVTVEWDDHGATPEDPYYLVRFMFSKGCTTDMFWGEELEALDAVTS